MRATREFVAGLLRLPMVWQVWVGLLAVVNGIVPLAFLDREGPVVLAVFVLGGAIGIGLTHLQGYTKLLGLMHFPWFGLVWWLWPHLLASDPTTWHGQWLRVLVAVNLTSLCIDVTHVARYALGDREEG